MTFEIMSQEAFRPVFREMHEVDDLYVYEAGGRVASTFRIARKQHQISHIAYFGSFTIHPDFRGKGLGRLIMPGVEAGELRQVSARTGNGQDYRLTKTIS